MRIRNTKAVISRLGLLGVAALALSFHPHESWAAGKKFYVMKTGNDGNPGTITQPFLSVRRGIDSTRAGDTLFVGPGEYDDAYGAQISWCDYSWDAGTMWLRYGGSSESNRLVVRSMHGQPRPVICGHRDYYDRYAVSMNNVNYITLDSLIVKHAARGIYIEGCDFVTVQNCVVCSTFIGGSAGAEADNNAGILMNYCDPGQGNIVRACSLFTNWGRTGTYPSYTLTQAYNHEGIISYRQQGGRLTGNVIWNQSGGIRLKSGIGYGMQVDGNVIHNCDFGIFGFGMDRSLVYNNTIYDVMEGITPQCRGNANDSPTVSMVIKNNTIYNNSGSGIKFEWPDSPQEGQFRQCSVYNNIVVSNNGGSREWAILKPELSSAAEGPTGVADLYENYNFWYDMTNSVPIRWITGSGSKDWTITQYRDSTIHGDNSQRIYPVFVDTARNVFRLAPSSPLLGQGRGGLDPGALIGSIPSSTDTIPPAPIFIEPAAHLIVR